MLMIRLFQKLKGQPLAVILGAFGLLFMVIIIVFFLPTIYLAQHLNIKVLSIEALESGWLYGQLIWAGICSFILEKFVKRLKAIAAQSFSS